TGFHRDNAFAAARLTPVFVERRALTDSVLTSHKEHRVRIDNGNSNDVIVFLRANSPNADGVAALIAQLLFMETQAHSFSGDEHDLVVAVRQFRIDQTVAVFDLNGDDAAAANVRVIR